MKFALCRMPARDWWAISVAWKIYSKQSIQNYSKKLTEVIWSTLRCWLRMESYWSGCTWGRVSLWGTLLQRRWRWYWVWRFLKCTWINILRLLVTVMHRALQCRKARGGAFQYHVYIIWEEYNLYDTVAFCSWDLLPRKNQAILILISLVSETDIGAHRDFTNQGFYLQANHWLKNFIMNVARGMVVSIVLFTVWRKLVLSKIWRAEKTWQYSKLADGWASDSNIPTGLSVHFLFSVRALYLVDIIEANLSLCQYAKCLYQTGFAFVLHLSTAWCKCKECLNSYELPCWWMVENVRRTFSTVASNEWECSLKMLLNGWRRPQDVFDHRPKWMTDMLVMM